MSNPAPKLEATEDLEKRAKRLADLAKERPGKLVAVQFGYSNETFVSVGFTNNNTVSTLGDSGIITLYNGVNEISLRMPSNRLIEVYISTKQFRDYFHFEIKKCGYV